MMPEHVVYDDERGCWIGFDGRQVKTWDNLYPEEQRDYREQLDKWEKNYKEILQKFSEGAKKYIASHTSEERDY